MRGILVPRMGKWLGGVWSHEGHTEMGARGWNLLPSAFRTATGLAPHQGPRALLLPPGYPQSDNVTPQESRPRSSHKPSPGLGHSPGPCPDPSQPRWEPQSRPLSQPCHGLYHSSCHGPSHSPVMTPVMVLITAPVTGPVTVPVPTSLAAPAMIPAMAHHGPSHSPVMAPSRPRHGPCGCPAPALAPGQLTCGAGSVLARPLLLGTAWRPQ